MIEAKIEHTGQYHPHGDSHTIWYITTGESAESAFAWAKENLLHGADFPSYDDWHRNIDYGGERAYDMAYYAAGYINFDKTSTGYRLEHVTPYMD